jgi:hypothetical protein
MIDAEAELRELLGTLSPLAREHLRNVLIREHADRDAIASQLLRHDENGQGWADIIDLLSMYPDARRRVVRALGELTARPTPRPSRTPKRGGLSCHSFCRHGGTGQRAYVLVERV